MINNHIKLAFRVLGRSKFHALTSILGLSFGLAIAVLICLYVRFELSFESNNPLAHRIVRITMDYLNGDAVIDQDAGTYHPMGPRIAAEFSDVEDYARVYPLTNTTIKVGNESLREHQLYAVDHSFLKLFNCTVISGDKDHALENQHEVMLTESAALKYFGTADILGESMLISRFKNPFKVIGVIGDSPLNTHLKYGLLISHATMKAEWGENGYLWDNNNAYTYLLLKDFDRYPDFLKQLDTFNDQIDAEGKVQNERVIAQPLKDIHLHSHKSFEIEQNGDAVSVYFLIGVGILVIVIAIVNHINLSTAKSLERAKEVGVRKVIGSSLNQLRIQFFTESLLINMIAAAIAFGIVIVALPFFRQIAGLPATFHSWSDPTFYVAIFGTMTIATLLSSIFPAFILSSFHPMKALKGKFSKSAGGVRMRKVLVTVQFAITVFLLIQTFTAKRQLDYMKNKDLGLDIEQTLVIRNPIDADNKNFQVFKDKILSKGQFGSMAFSSCVPGQSTSEMASTNIGVTLVGGATTESFNFYITFNDADFLSTMKIDLAAGDDFTVNNPIQDKILVNEAAIKLWHIPDAASAVGQQIQLWGKQRTIIGVVKNYHQSSPKADYLPMIFFQQEGSNKLASIRFTSGDIQKNIAGIKEIYETVFPGSPFEYFFLDEEFDQQYRADEQFGQVFGTLTIFAVLISALGLFGLVSVAVANRTKEIGIRKVLGASVSQIIGLVSRDFVGLVVLSVVLSTGVTYFVIKAWLDRYAFRIELGSELFLIPGMLIVALSLITVAIRTFGAAVVNPVRSLKEE